MGEGGCRRRGAGRPARGAGPQAAGRRSPVFEVDLEQAAIAAEEALDVLLPDVVAQAADVDARHVRGGGGEGGGRGEERERGREKEREKERDREAARGERRCQARTLPQPRPAPQHNGARRPPPLL